MRIHQNRQHSQNTLGQDNTVRIKQGRDRFFLKYPRRGDILISVFTRTDISYVAKPKKSLKQPQLSKTFMKLIFYAAGGGYLNSIQFLALKSFLWMPFTIPHRVGRTRSLLCHTIIFNFSFKKRKTLGNRIIDHFLNFSTKQ